MKFSVSIEHIPTAGFKFMFHELPLLQRPAAAARHGFDAIDIWDWLDKDMDALGNAACQAGVVINSTFGNRFGSLVDERDHQRVLEEVEESLEMAKRCGVQYLLLFTDAIGPEGLRKQTPLPDEEKYANLIAGLEQVVKLAEQKADGVMLAMEPVNNIFVPGYFLHTSRRVADVIRRIHHPKLRMAFDIFHLQLVEGNIMTNLQKYLPLCDAVHMADVPSRGEPGTGELNLKNIMQLLVEEHFTGLVEFEMMPTSSSEEAVRAIKGILPR
ncbi:MAG: TIM barrel protein [Deinococcus sp.]|nr:TIM barrel protein [Deinococcus sp.]